MLITDPPSQLARGRISEDTRQQIVTRFERSDLTQRAFCEQAGLPVSTLQWWLTKARREAARRTPVTFAEFTLPEVARPDRGVGRIGLPGTSSRNIVAVSAWSGSPVSMCCLSAP